MVPLLTINHGDMARKPGRRNFLPCLDRFGYIQTSPAQRIFNFGQLLLGSFTGASDAQMSTKFYVSRA